MSIQSDLRKDGIEVLHKIDGLTVNSIAKNVAHKIVATFPEMNLNEKDLFIKLTKLNMYKAIMPDGMAEATYFYKNSSIYFKSDILNEDIEEVAIHECIHYLQQIKNKNKLIRMGISTYSGSKVIGLGLNEAAVQLMTSKIIGIQPDVVKYYGIDIKTASPSYYPMECNLLEQITYLYGENLVYDSTFNSNDNFRNTFIKITSKKTYEAILNAVDEIVNYEECILKYNNELQNKDISQKKLTEIQNNIEKLKENISTIFMRTQNLIISSYFDSTFKKIKNLEELDNYRKKLEGYKKIYAKADGYFFFDNYYTEKMCALEHKCNIMENGGYETALVATKVNIATRIINSIKNILSKKTIKN